MIGDPKDGDGEPDKMQVAGMRIARFKAWVAGKIKGLFTKRKISAVETNRPTMVSSRFFTSITFVTYQIFKLVVKNEF